MYLLHGCKGANKCTRSCCRNSFHTAILTRDDEIYCKEDVPRVFNPWLMQSVPYLETYVYSDQSTARTILRQPISVHMIDVNHPAVPVVKQV